jgi:hypothetical protein
LAVISQSYAIFQEFQTLALPPVLDPFPDHTDALYKALGKGMLHWQKAETALYLVTLCFMETDHETGSRVFFHIKSAETKLTLADRLAFLKMEKDAWTKYWEPIVKDIRDAIKFRNYLAHFDVFQLQPEDMAAMPTSYRVAISFHYLDEHARRASSIRTLSVEHIEHNTEEIRFLTYKIIYFLFDHAPRLEPFLKRLPPNILQWLDPLRKMTRPPEFPLPPRSSRA